MLLLVGVGRREGLYGGRGGAFNLASERGGGLGGRVAADDDLYTCSHRTLCRGYQPGSAAHIAQEAGSVTPVNN